MNLSEFITTNPNDYGTGNANLFYSSSISGSEDTPVAPFTVLGVSIPFSDLNSNNLVSPLKEVSKFKFTFGGQRVEATITGRQKKNDYFFFSFTPFTVNTLPTTNQGGALVELRSEFVFNPYFESNYFNSDYNPLQGNSSELLRNSATMVVDYKTSQNIPTNLDALIAGTAERAQIVDSAYETAGLISGKYNGAKLTSAPANVNIQAVKLNKHSFTTLVNANAVAGSEPALVFKKFEGSKHPSDGITNKIQNLAEREKIDVYFNSVLVNNEFPNYPTSSNVLYEDAEGSNDLIKLADAKVFALETGQVFTTDRDGVITNVES